MNHLIKFFLISIFVVIQGCAVPPHIQKGINVSESNSYSRITSDLNASHSTIAGRNHTLTFNTLNGKNLGPPFSGSRPTEINLLPGSHKFEVQYYYYGSFARACIELEPVAGVNYMVKYITQDYSVAFWLETLDGDVVGNICGLKSDTGKPKEVS